MDLIAEDLLLLLLDDTKGTTPSTWVDPRIPLGAALLADLALAGAVEAEEPASRWRSVTLRAVPSAAPDDPLLLAAYQVVAHRPRGPRDLAHRVGDGLKERIAARLVDAGVLERSDGHVLGVFPRTTWPAVRMEREDAVRAQLHAVLTEGAEPSPRDAVLIGILAALDRIPATFGLHGADASHAKRRAKAVAQGQWASKAVQDAVDAAMVAVITSTVAATTVATTAGN
jgi:hypothetical protein